MRFFIVCISYTLNVASRVKIIFYFLLTLCVCFVYNHTHMSKRNKKRFQISLSPTIARRGRHIAKMEGRSFSNFLEFLISREGSKVTQSEPIKEAA